MTHCYEEQPAMSTEQVSTRNADSTRNRCRLITRGEAGSMTYHGPTLLRTRGYDRLILTPGLFIRPFPVKLDSSLLYFNDVAPMQ